MGKSCSKVTAIIVSYQPEYEGLERLLISLIPQVGRVLVVDNGSSADVGSWLQTRFTVVSCLQLDTNYGIAYAQNRGIDWAKQMGSDSVLLLDQDSEPEATMVETLVSAIHQLEGSGHLVACSGPCYVDERQQKRPPFIRIRGVWLERCQCATHDSLVQVDYLIASGCLIPMIVLDRVGAMREELFIDYVDIEWGLRARSMGFVSYGVCGAHMKHNLGKEPIRRFGRAIPLHSALRHYYHFRNAVLLYREPWIPLNWKFVDICRLLRKYVFYTVYARPRSVHWRMMTLGLWHGALGKVGKRREK